MKYPQVCVRKFALYLYENNHLEEDYTIPKEKAAKIFAAFKSEFGIDDSFHNLLHRSRWIVSFVKGGVVKYHAKLMEKLRQDRAKIDMAFNSAPERSRRRSPNRPQPSSSSTYDDNKKSNSDGFQGLECKLCYVRFEDKERLEKHRNEKGHIFRHELDYALKFFKNHPDLKFTINGCSNLGNSVVRKNSPKICFLKILNDSNNPVTILQVQTNDLPEVDFKPIVPYTFRPQTSFSWELEVHSKKDGVLVFSILMQIEVRKKVQKHAIQLFFHTQTPLFDGLQPVVPYNKVYRKRNNNFIEDSPPRENSEIETDTRLPLKEYRIPKDLFTLFNYNFKPFPAMSKEHQAQLDYVKSLVLEDDKKKSLTVMQNYTNLLEVMLYAEEHQLLRDVRSYDQDKDTLKPVGPFLELQVPDLAERRPSIMVSDTVHLRHTKHSKEVYDGVVQQVTDSSVILRFPKSFMKGEYVKDRKYFITFSFNRYTIRTQHRALELTKSDNIEYVFFPKHLKDPPINLDFDLQWFNKDVANNPEQQQAIRAILKKSAMPAPYLIFGPPGTGKTMTVVECVKQVYQRTNEKILICAPSNGAGNEITKRLIDTIPKEGLFRYVARSFSDFMPDELLEFSNCHSDSFYQPDISELMKYRIVITTLVTAAKLASLKCAKNHFSYVFIDEAGQATETETMIPIAGILSNKDETGCISGQIVLAGDPRQLGPVIHSTMAKEYGYDISTLERLIDTCDLYAKDTTKEYNPYALTKLLKNYRSHSTIIEIPNSLFYDNELQTAGDKSINIALNWSGLPNKGFPLIFHNVVGADQREKSSPSYFNVQEIQTIAEYLDQLIGTIMEGIKINGSHIMIVSPYKKQVQKIRQYCDMKKYTNILIGSVEQVQGQERLIVILSAVRSQPHLLQYDQMFHLGFLNNPKRFNVAITRAKALLIIVGNSNLLQLDKCWKSLIEYCKNNGAMVGEKFDFGGESDETLSDAQNMSLFNETPSEESASFSGGI